MNKTYTEKDFFKTPSGLTLRTGAESDGPVDTSYSGWLDDYNKKASAAATGGLAGRSLSGAGSMDFLNAGRSLLDVADPKPAYAIPALMEEAQKANDATRKYIGSQFDTQIEDAELRGKSEVGGADLAVDRLRGEGLSTAAEAYVRGYEDQAEKRVERLKRAKIEAEAALDTELAKTMKDLMIKENERIDKISEQRFNRALSIMGFGLSLRGDERADKSFTREGEQFDKTFGLQEQQFENTVQQQSLLTRREARDFALTNGITKPAYQIGGTWVRASDGHEFKDMAEAQAAGITQDMVQMITPTSKAARDYVLALSTSYPDAKIGLDDPVEIAQNKLKSSKIYQEKIRPPSTTTADSQNLSYLEKTAGAGIYQLAKTINPATGQNFTWGEIADNMARMNLDPGKFDDTFHRVFDTPQQYEEYRKKQVDLKKGSAGGTTITAPDGTTIQFGNG